MADSTTPSLMQPATSLQAGEGSWINIKDAVLDKVSTDMLLTADNISLYQFATSLLITFFLTYLVSIFYRKYSSSISDRNSFSKTFILIGMTTMLIITVVKSSLALSLGLVGALSIVRFRAAIKEPEELAYLFLVIAIGLGMGAGQAGVTTLAMIIVLLFAYFQRKTKQQARTDALHRLSVTVSKDSVLGLEEITAILIEEKTSPTIKRVDYSNDHLEVSAVLEIDDVETLSRIRNKLANRDNGILFRIIDSRPII